MTLRIDTAEWIPGKLVIGGTGLGVLGQNIPSTGDNGPGYTYNDLSLPADNAKEICGRIVSWPSAGVLFANEDTSFTFSSAPDGTYTFQYQLYVDGVATGSPATVTITVGVSSQYARPVSDTSAGTWVSFPSGTLASCLDEVAVDTGDYIVTLNASTCEVQLGTISDPGVLTGHGLDYELSASTGGIKVRLRNNGATVKEWVHSPAPSSPTLYNQTLNTTEAGTINWSFPLSLQFEAI